jgi:hypothetical protein
VPGPRHPRSRRPLDDDEDLEDEEDDDDDDEAAGVAGLGAPFAPTVNARKSMPASRAADSIWNTSEAASSSSGTALPRRAMVV